MDFETGEIVDVLPDRKKAYLTQYFSMIKCDTFKFTTNMSELDNVKFISIDMYENFRNIARTFFPMAKVCADSFHVLKHLTDDFRKVRIKCQNSTENPTLKHLLVKFNKAFDHKYQNSLDNEPRYNKKLGRYINYRGIRDLLFENFPVLKVAFELKEYYIDLNSQATLQTAPTRIDEAISIFGNCGIDEYEEFHLLLVNWREEIINSFNVIGDKRINNSFMESKNRIVSRLIYNANGFKNFKKTRNRILFCLNPNDTFKV
jgi:transposase